MIGKPLEFVISDLNISSMRRTIEAGDKEITTAQVKLTLQEIPIEAIKSVQFGKPNIVIPLTPGDAEGAAASAVVGPSLIAKQVLDFSGYIGFEEPEVEQSFPQFVLNPGRTSNAGLGNDQSQIVYNYVGVDMWGFEDDGLPSDDQHR
jgi:hypothetical protein